jgi:hypothetical protein
MNKPKTRGRKAGWSRTGSVLSGKKLTEWEALKVMATRQADKDRWTSLFSRNKWTTSQ